MPQISVPKSFFVNERRMYSNWQFAFWREFFQNSVDAGATRIDVTIRDHGSNRIEIVFADDGCGMDRQILNDVYFRLGATSKGSDDSCVGGFGRARILTCFSMDRYEIHTRNNRVIGSGGEYDIYDSDHFAGTKVTVDVSDESYYQFYDNLRSYLSLSQMNCDVYVDDQKFSAWNCRRKMTRTLDKDGSPFAQVYVNKSGEHKNLIIVRVAGAVMYYEYTSANAQIIVEIEPSMSRQVLTANRDGMQSSYQRILNQFAQEVASETETALRPKVQRKNATIRGRGLLVSYAKRTESASPVSASSSNTCASSNQVSVAETFGRSKVETTDGGEKVLLPQTNQSRLPDVFIVDETENASVRRVIDNFNPSNWRTIYDYRNGRDINKGGTIHKLLMLWKVACSHAIESLQKTKFSSGDVAWGIGWVFSETALARCMSVTGGHAFLLNPVDSDGNLRFFISSQSSQKSLMATAKHEVAHLISSYHNETYAMVLTAIDEAFDEREVYRKMREEIAEIKAMS